ncbi:MAG: TolC family protein [Kofleriaceae bacterium]
MLLARTAYADEPNAPENAVTEKVTFVDAVKRAIAHNPDRLVALHEIERVQGLLMQATAALLPQVGVSAIYTRLEGDRFVMDRRSQAANSLHADVNVDTPLIDLHAFAERKRAHDRVEVTAAEAESTKRDVAIATARAYFAAFSAAKYLDITKHARDSAKAYADAAGERRHGGVGTELDLKRAQAQLAVDEAQVASAITAKLRAEEALGVIIGSERPVAANGEPDLADSTSNDISKRADVIASRMDREAASESRHLDWMNWAPTLHLTGEGFYQAPQIDPMPRWGYEIDVTLDFRIYDGGLRSGLHHQHRAEEDEAKDREVGVDRQATSEVRTARAAVDSTKVARDASRKAAELGAGVLELATLGYTAGTATSLDVVDAEKAALDADSQALIAEDDYRQAQLDLLAATGVFPGP